MNRFKESLSSAKMKACPLTKGPKVYMAIVRMAANLMLIRQRIKRRYEE